MWKRKKELEEIMAANSELEKRVEELEDKLKSRVFVLENQLESIWNWLKGIDAIDPVEEIERLLPRLKK